MNKEEAIKQLKKHKQEIDKQCISSRYSKAIEVALNLIQKQEKIIDKMAEFLEDELTIDEFCNKENCYADEYINGHCQKCLNCIKEYFKKEVEKDAKD